MPMDGLLAQKIPGVESQMEYHKGFGFRRPDFQLGDILNEVSGIKPIDTN